MFLIVQFEWYNIIKKKERFQFICEKYDTVSASSKLHAHYMSEHGESLNKNSI